MAGYYGSPKVVLQNNKALLGEKNKLSRKDYIGSIDSGGHDPIKATPELLEEIRIRFQAENKKRKKRQILFALLSLVITLCLLLIVVFA